MENSENRVKVQKPQDTSLTYIGKYQCQNDYLNLKECLNNAQPANIRRECDKHYEIIGTCILNAYQNQGNQV